MKKVAFVFVLAVFVPSLVLAWLAVRSLRDQQFVLERQRSLLYQGVADSVAKEAANLLAEHQREFARQVEALLADSKPIDIASSFDKRLYSKVAPSEAEFRQLIGDSTEGTLARFLQNKLNLMFWYRSPRDPQIVFGALIDLPKLIEGLRGLVKMDSESLHNEICVALLDDTARVAAKTNPAFQTNWKRPFVATEVGEALPHWEIAVYLLNPAKLSQSAQMLKLTFGLLIAVLVLAIGVGGWLIVADLKRQLTLARQKTDFVSNV